MPVCEITLEELQRDWSYDHCTDWIEVFADDTNRYGEYTTQDVESLDGTPTHAVYRADVVEIIAAVNGENDTDDWVGVFRMKDGRFLAAHGGCDYTGWG